MESIVELIQESVSSLKNAERRVAEYILEHLEEIQDLTITELADRAKTSDPTVIRFCRKIGLKGYTDLRLHLARDVPSKDLVRDAVSDQDSPVKILHKIFQANTDALHQSLSSLDSIAFEQAVDLLVGASQISFYAFGGSGNIARDAHHKFFRLGKPCFVYSEAHMLLMDASLLPKGAVVVVISLKGSTRDLVEAVHMARKSGAKVIGLIGRKKSPLGNACDLCLTVEVNEVTAGIFPIATRLTQLALMDALYMSVSMKTWPEVKGNIEKVKNTLSHRNY